MDNECEEDVKITSKPGESLLFVYQAKWQKRLLLKYGNQYYPYSMLLTKQQDMHCHYFFLLLKLM